MTSYVCETLKSADVQIRGESRKERRLQKVNRDESSSAERAEELTSFGGRSIVCRATRPNERTNIHTYTHVKNSLIDIEADGGLSATAAALAAALATTEQASSREEELRKEQTVTEQETQTSAHNQLPRYIHSLQIPGALL